jgi:membrane protein insertase Oxa1/YidC/SpoIIIJ
LFLLLDFIHDFVNNWGVSIILTTFLIKLVFYKLTATSGRSMAKMRKLAPRMKALQEKHKEDRQALSQAMMDLYKREKVNPAAGCLPDTSASSIRSTVRPSATISSSATPPCGSTRPSRSATSSH